MVKIRACGGGSGATTLAIPVMLIAMAPHLLGWRARFHYGLDATDTELALSAPAVLWAAVPYYRRGWLGVVHRAPKCTR